MTNPNPLPALLPCPMCGKAVACVTTSTEMWPDHEDEGNAESYAVMCDASKPGGPGGCGASGGFALTEAEAIAAWNRRAESAIAALGSSMPSGEASEIKNKFGDSLIELAKERAHHTKDPETFVIGVEWACKQFAAQPTAAADDARTITWTGGTPTAAVQGGLTGIQNAADLMRIIDAYAFDYQADGKLGASRRDVERALRAALSANAGSQPVAQFLCRIWGEDIDHTLVALVPDWEGVRRFCIEQWTGSEDATDYDGSSTLQNLKDEFDEHEKDERGGAYVQTWEIGGVSVERVCDCTPANADATPKEAGSQPTIAGLKVVIDSSIPEGEFRLIQPTAAGAVPTDDQIDREWHRVLMLPNASDHGYGRARNFARAVLALAAPADGKGAK